jgi:UrcA family protein
MTIKLAATGLFAFACLAPGFASARPSVDAAQTLSASYSTLDLGTTAGRRHLGEEIDRLVTRICGTSKVGDLQARSDEMNCRREAWGSTRAQITAAVMGARHVPVQTASTAKDAAGLGESLTVQEAKDIFRFRGSY